MRRYAATSRHPIYLRGTVVFVKERVHALTPSPVVALNRAVVMAEVEQAAAALRVVNSLQLNDYYLFHAIRADLLCRLGQYVHAIEAYEAAIAQAANRLYGRVSLPEAHW